MHKIFQRFVYFIFGVLYILCILYRIKYINKKINFLPDAGKVVVSLVIGDEVVVGILGELHKDSLQQITEQSLNCKRNPVGIVSNKLHASWLH